MTEERYIITIASEYLDIQEDKWLTIDEVFDLLNKQDQRIKELENYIEHLQEHNIRLLQQLEKLEK